MSISDIVRVNEVATCASSFVKHSSLSLPAFSIGIPCKSGSEYLTKLLQLMKLSSFGISGQSALSILIEPSNGCELINRNARFESAIATWYLSLFS